MFDTARCADFDFLSAEYRDLFARSSGTLFQHPLWLHHLYTFLAPAKDAEPVVITVREEETGQLLMVLPLVARGGLARRVEFADLGVSDYAAPVADLDWIYELTREQDISGDVWRACGRADLLFLEKIPSSAAWTAHLFGASDMRSHSYEAFEVGLETSLEMWRHKHLSASMARRLDKARKRLRHRKLELREVSEPGQLDVTLERLREFRLARFAGQRAVDLMQDPDYFEFYRRVAHASARHGGPGRTYALVLDGVIAGAAFDLADASTEVHILSGFDFENYRSYSLGLLLVDELIAHAISRQMKTFDLTIGHDAYKREFGGAAVPVHMVRRAVTLRGETAKISADANASLRRVAKRILTSYEQHRAGQALSAVGSPASTGQRLGPRQGRLGQLWKTARIQSSAA